MSLSNNRRCVSFVELVTAIVLITVVVLGVMNIEIFSRFQILSADRRVKLQHEASVALEHMTKNITLAIGGRNNDPVSVVAGGINIRIDRDNGGNYNGMLDNTDIQIGYRFQNNQILFFPNVANATNEAIATRVSGFTVLCNANDTAVPPIPINQLEVAVSTRWVPAEAISTENPEFTLRTRIIMPSVPTN